MSKYNEHALFESINSLRETMAMMEGPFDAIAKPLIKPAVNAVKDYATWARKGYQNPSLGKIQSTNTDAMHRGVRAGADANELVNSPNARAAALAGGAGAATLGTAAMYGDKAEHPVKGTPQDMSTHGGGYLDDTNPGYKYNPYDASGTAAKPTDSKFQDMSTHGGGYLDDTNPGYKYNPYNDPDETGTVIGIDGSDDEDTGTVIGIDGDTSSDSAAPKSATPQKGAAAQKTPGAQKGSAPATNKVYDPEVAAIQQELVNKQYPLTVDGKWGPKTQAAYEYDQWSQSRDAKIKGYDTAVRNMDPNQPAPALPTDPAQKAAYDAAMKNMQPENTQGDFDRYPEINEHVSFSNDESLARILQLAKW